MTTVAANHSPFATPTARTETLCAHCSLPAPQRGVDELSFCCAGCEVAYASIRACGLGDYHELRRRTENTRAAAHGLGRSFAEFDDPAFLKSYAAARADDIAITLVLEGLHCAACVWLIERLPTAIPGLIRADLDAARSTVRLLWNPEKVRLSEIARVLDRFGYACHAARGLRARDARRRDERALLTRLAAAGAIAGNTMLLAFALYAGDFAGMQHEFRTAFRWISAGLALVSLLWPGRVFLTNAALAIKTRTPHLDLPIALGLLAGTAAGLLNTIRSTGEVYFDSITILIFVLLVGRWFNLRQQRLAADNLETLFALTPRTVRRVEHAVVRETSLESVEADDILEVLAGDSIPADGEVISGNSQVDESLLTGEAVPIDVSAGSRVAAGSVNLSGVVRLRVSATGADTRVGKLFALMTETASRRAPVVRAADRIGVRFVSGMIALSLFTLLVWLPVDSRLAVENSTALLIVTCPCALGLATPLALTILMGRAARKSILIKGADAVESLTRPGVLFLDKTGTLTMGRQSLVHFAGDQSVRPLVAAIQRHSTHPLAKACVRTLGEIHLPTSGVRQTTAAGIEGSVDGTQLTVGTRAFVTSRVTQVPAWIEIEAEAMSRTGLTPVWVARDSELVAIMGFGDELRPEATAAVDALKAGGWRIGVLSGDHAGAVERVASAIGAERALVFSAMSPEAKLEIVSAHARTDTTVMVGDGVNDAAALAAASVGIAVHGGAEASLESADVYLGRPGLTPVVELIGASRNAMRGIKICFAVSLMYNLGAAGLAVIGAIHPLVAAVLMPISSLTVLGIAHATARVPARSYPMGKAGEPCR